MRHYRSYKLQLVVTITLIVPLRTQFFLDSSKLSYIHYTYIIHANAVQYICNMYVSNRAELTS